MSGNGAKLVALTRQRSVQWQQTKECWKDAKCEEFERKYIQELSAGVDRAVTVMCGHGERAMTGASVLEANGARDLRVLVGGPDDWAHATGETLEVE